MATIYGPPSEVGDFEFDYSSSDGYEAYDKAVEDYLTRLAAWCRDNGSGELVGETISFPVADGKAVYMVYRERPCALIHVPIGDAYQADAILERGIRLADVREHVRREKAIRTLFSGS